ncbi:non-structural maintenance of chromosomes element 1 homolog isoform X2 [Pararge aegeria]|uniref:non-structural maintenance of chromosomes element 1 homolog isoform X2 n=1 Tax=Pararge aegeria TaxID=116150 RepID=UPI0019D0E2B0|nr:non-structural maintenance of chromosomes element 1 homolog isoform X2 [Pararge aegeria]
MSYGEVHRFFLRTIASKGVLTFSNAQNILDQSYPEDKPSIEDLAKQINDTIRPFQQTIKIVNDEVTSEKNIVFLFLGFDDATKSQNMFSAQELEFFRTLIEEIMTTESRQISSQYALNLVNKLKVPKTDAQRLLRTWCRMHYLVEINTNYALGLRAIHEFQHYLRENMPDTINECCLCKEIVFRGYNCPLCGDAVHTRCLNMYLEAGPKWPCCKANFDTAQLETLNRESISETQLSTQLTTQHTTQKTNGTQHTTQQRNDSIEESIETSDDDFEQTLGTPIPGVSQRVSRKRKRMTRD